MTPSRPAVVRTNTLLKHLLHYSIKDLSPKQDADSTCTTVLLGATNPLASAPGTIRGDFSIDVGRNVCHGSDSVENAKKEIALWFKEGEVVSYKASQFDWVYEKA